MAALGEEDFVPVADEKFDFDISLSPASSKGDEEDEVFVGPLRHKEKCVAYSVEAWIKDSVSSGPCLGKEAGWRRLTGDDFEEISKEAQQVVSHLDNRLHGSSKVPESSVDAVFTAATEIFEADSVSVAKRRLSPIKRETFCIQDSPLKQLPPAIQQRLMKANGASTTTAVSGPAKSRLSTSSPIRQPSAQPRMTLRSKAGLAGPRSVLPSKPTVPVATKTPVKTRPAPPDKNKLHPPTRGNLGPRRSMSCRISTRMGSTEDLLSDSASVTSDVSDTSLNTSLTGKRSIPPPSKPALRRSSTVKAPVTSQRVVDRGRNTSSSSSSVSSINSSITASPMPKVKLNSGLCAPIPAAAKSRRSSVLTRAPEPPAPGRRSMSVQSGKPSEPLARPVRSTPCKKPDPASVPTPRQTPARRSVAPSSGAQAAKAESTVKGNPRLTGLISATPTNPSKGPNQSEAFVSPNGSRIMKPKRLMSACSMESLTQKSGPASGLQTPSSGRDKSLPVSKLRRLSVLPTPSGHHVSSVPIQTPKSSTKPRLYQRTESLPAPSREACARSPSQMEEINLEPQQTKQANSLSCDESRGLDKSESCSLIFSLEPEGEAEPPRAPASLLPELVNKPEPQLVSMEPQSAPKMEKTSDQLQLDITQSQKMTEVLLMDLPAPALSPEEKPLIDLSNTPDLIKTASVKPCGEPLIDLSSPLIKWSPDDKKENVVNEAPLIDLSF